MRDQRLSFPISSERRLDLEATHIAPPVPGRAAAAGGGQALPADVRAKMEAAFGADFSAVRVHEGQASQALGAQAYAQGTDLHFAPGQYQPDSQRGQELIGHELAHVVQQSQGRVSAAAQAKGAGINADAGLEAEADDLGARAARGERVTGGGGPAQCKILASSGGGPVQCKKFRDNGTPIGMLEAEPRDAHDTEQIEAFDRWLTTLDAQALKRVYTALDEIASPTRAEAIARSRVKTLQVSAGPAKGADNALGALPKDQWWKLFVDRGAHDDKQSNTQNAMRFDNESSPGFYDAMMRAYEQVLAPTEEGLRTDLSPDDLVEIHDMVTAGTLTKTDNSFGATPHALSGRGSQGTTFPMTKKDDELPSAVAFEELAASGVVGLDSRAQGPYQTPIVDGDNPERRFRKRATAASTGNSMTNVRPLSNYVVDTNYDQQDATAIMGELLDAYHDERGRADKLTDDSARDATKLRAIVKVIRGLHTAHVFTDANGRLNTMVLLNKFLLEEGFDPVIMDDTSMFGGGFSVEQLVGQVTRGMNTFSQQARNTAPWGKAKRDYPWFHYAEDDQPTDIRMKLLHVITLERDKLPHKHDAKIAAAMKRFRARACSITSHGSTITRLGFQKSMDALLLENELETLTRD